MHVFRAAAAVRYDERLGKSLSLVFDDKVEPNDQAFWVTLTAESGEHRGQPFYFNMRTGLRTWKKPPFVRAKEKAAADFYIRVW